MKLNGRCLIVFTVALIALMPGAYGGIQILTSGGVSSERSSVLMNFDTQKSAAVNSQIAINGATITPSTTITGSINTFEETHAVTDRSGKSASVYVKVVNAENGLTYRSKVLPKEGSVTTRTKVSAEQWLTVPKADFIECSATSSYRSIRSAIVGLKEDKSSSDGDYVSITGYHGSAVTTAKSSVASQTAASGEANSIRTYGTAMDGIGTYRVDTLQQGISGGKATFTGLSETSSAGTYTLVEQTAHVHGTFASTAAYEPLTGAAIAKVRTSNFGTEYDLTMAAKKYVAPRCFMWVD